MVDVSICSRVLSIRNVFKLTQLDFAKKLNVKQGNIADIERNKREPSKELIKSLISICGINANWLLTGEGEMFTCNKEDNAEIKKRLAEAEEELRQLRLQYASLQDQNEELNQEIKDRLRQIVGLQEKLIPQN